MTSASRPLTFAVTRYGHTERIIDGDIAVPGFDLQYVPVSPMIGAYRRMVRELEFDICELAPTTYLMSREAGIPIIGLPIFIMRKFHHSGIAKREGANIDGPKDLERRSVGVRAYSVTSGVWTRGVFSSEYDVDLDAVTWVVDDEDHVQSYRNPDNVRHVAPGSSLADLLAEGRLDAALTGPAGIGRKGSPTTGWEQDTETAQVRYAELILDAEAREAEWFQRTGIYPIHGLLVVKESVVQEFPDLAPALIEAFGAAKDEYIAKLPSMNGDAGKEDTRYQRLSRIVGSDPLPYGFEANRASLQALADFSVQQKLLRSQPDLRASFIGD